MKDNLSKKNTHIAALLVYTLLACVVTFPLLLHLSTHLPTMPGEMGQDVWQNSWNVWWVHRALLVEHTNPYVTNMLFYPEGASLYLHSLILPLGIIGLPLTTLLKSVITYNILTILVLMLAGYCSFVLIQHVVGSAPAALVGGAIAMLSPQRLFELRGAQMATMNDYGVPLVLLALLIALQPQQRTWRMALLVAALLLLNGLNKWYHLFHSLLLMAMLLVWRSGIAWRQGTYAALRQEFVQWGRIALLSFLLLLPFLLPALIEVANTSYAHKSDELVISADLLRLLPSHIGGVWETVPTDWWYTHLYGFVPVGLALVGFALAPRQSIGWGIIALTLLLLSFGPHLRVGNEDTGIPMPYALFRLLPVFDIFRAPVRMNLVVTLLLGMIAAYGLAKFLPRLPGVAAWAAAVSLIGIIAIEALRLPFPLVDGQLSPFYAQVADEPGHWSLLELPFDRQDREVLEMYQQMHHNKYILTGRPARSVPGLPYRYAPPIAQADSADTRSDIVALSPIERDQLLRGLRVRYLVVRPSASHPDQAFAQVAAARQTLGSLTEVYRDTELTAYRLDKTATWLDGEGHDTLESVPLFVGLDQQWEPLEESGYGLIRWLPADGGGMWVYSQQARTVALELSLYSIAGAAPLEVWLNDELLSTIPVAEGLTLRRYSSGPIALPSGRSFLTLRTSASGVTPHSVGLGDDTRLLTFGIQRVRLVEMVQ